MGQFYYIEITLHGCSRLDYFLNIYLAPAPTPEVTGSKPRPTPPPGLTPPVDEGRTGIKTTDGRPLEKVDRQTDRQIDVSQPKS